MKKKIKKITKISRALLYFDIKSIITTYKLQKFLEHCKTPKKHFFY